MVATTESTTDLAGVTAERGAPQPFRWTRAMYHKLSEVGLLTEDDPIELIEGELVQMAARNPPHSVAVAVASEVLREVFRPGYHIRGQDALGLGDRSEPEPDIAVVTGSPRDYRVEHPRTAALVVEVADTSLRYDRTRKSSLYARFDLPEFWIINLQERVLEVYREPAEDRTAHYGASYTRRFIVEADGMVTPLAAPNRQVRVSDLLP